MILNRKHMKWEMAAKYSMLLLPALALGVVAMIYGGVSPMMWGQQIAAWIAFPLLAVLLKRAAGRFSAAAWSVLLVGLLVLTFLSEEAGGAKRWLDLGVFQVRAAMLVLPALLVVLCRMEHPHAAWIAAAAVLCFQPDLSQLAAFGAAVLPVLWMREKKPLWKILHAVLFFGLMVRCARSSTCAMWRPQKPCCWNI